ncbi:MAG: lysophospholipid acyltransferase family protein [Acidimicrobiia bacterium]
MSSFRYIPSALTTRFLNIPLRILARGLLDFEVSGTEHIPKQGPLVVASNHFSHLDPPLVVNALGRLVRFIAVDELFGNHLTFDVVTKYFGAIPTDRDGVPLRALEETVEYLRAGGTAGVFPEGRRVASWRETEPKRGAAWLAWMSGAPLLPVTIHGTNRVLGQVERGVQRTAVRIWIDKPILWFDYTERTDPLGAMTNDWYKTVDTHLTPWWPKA